MPTKQVVILLTNPLPVGTPSSASFTGSFVKPPGVTSIVVECWGGGGLGGPGFTNPTFLQTGSGGGGGAGGQYARKTLTYDPSQSTIPYVIATPRVPIAEIPNSPQPIWKVSVPIAGQDTFWGSHSSASAVVLAKGGAGGYSASAAGFPSGAGGIGSTSGGIGDVVYKGGDGTAGWQVTEVFPSILTSSIQPQLFGMGIGGGGAGSTGNGSSSFKEGPIIAAETPEFGAAGSTVNQNFIQSYAGGGIGGANDRVGFGYSGPGLIRLTFDAPATFFEIGPDKSSPVIVSSVAGANRFRLV